MAYPRVQKWMGYGWYIKYCDNMNDARKHAMEIYDWKGLTPDIYRGTELLGSVIKKNGNFYWDPWDYIGGNRYDYVRSFPINKDGSLKK